MRFVGSSLQLVVATSLMVFSISAYAKPTIAVLNFGGEEGTSARRLIVAKLKSSFSIVSGDRILAACDELGITMSRGENLARAAAHVGAFAVLGGSVNSGRLAIALYSGKNGEPILARAVPWGPSRRYLRKALAVIRHGLRKAPKPVSAPPVEPVVPAEPIAPAPTDTPKVDDPPPLVFEPDRLDQSDGASGGDLSVDPSAEDPFGGFGPKKVEPAPRTTPLSHPPAAGGNRKIEGHVGLGTWMRSFSLSDPVSDRPHPQYSSGAAFALQLAARVRPLAFFFQGIPANFWSRLRFQSTLGLSSQVRGGQEGLGTSLYEFLFDLGYDHKIGHKPTSPHVEAGIGYGALNFAIDWAGNSPTLPDSAYQFILIGAGFRYPFLGFFGAHARIDYRIVLGTGEIENTTADKWYGPASTGGIAFSLGVFGTFKKFIFTAEYTYTRFFYTFTEFNNRKDANQRAADGALDLFHGLIVSAGYSY